MTFSSNSGLPKSVFSDSSLGSETSDGPHPDLCPRVELLPPHVPHSLVWHSLGFGLKVKVTCSKHLYTKWENLYEKI